MSASNLYMNWSSVTIAYGIGPTTITLKKVTDVQFPRKGKEKSFFGDADLYPTLVVSKEKERTCTIKSGALNLLSTIPEDTPCTITAILNDAKNGSGSGAATFTLVNAILVTNTANDQTNNFGQGEAMFHAYSSDGATDPLTVAIAS